MKRLKNNIKIETLLAIIALVFLPLYSIYLSSKASLFYENLTYVGNLKGNRTLFITWGILQSVCYFVCFLKLHQKLLMKDHYLLPLSFVLTLISIIAFLLPYTNHSGDLLSQLHVYGSMFSCIITYFMIMLVLYHTASLDYTYFTNCKNLLFIILTVFAFCIILLGDISTLSELILLNGLNLQFIYMLKKYHA